MKKKLGLRNIIIVALCITIVFLCVGICVVTMQYDALKKEKHEYGISFTEIEKVSSTKGGTYEPVSEVKIDKEGKELDLYYKLYTSHDEVTYNAVIKNTGTMKIKIIDLLESPNYSVDFNKSISPVSITYSDIIDKTLEPGESKDLKIVVTYNPSTMATGLREFKYKIGLIVK